MERLRRLVQLIFLFLANGRLFITPSNPIYTGSLKHICFPGLNCYSCPAATWACPLGAIQNVFTTLKMNIHLARPNFGLYVIGSMGIVGALFGRMPCAWFCPFGLLQELCFKIKVPKLPYPKFLDMGRYIFLILFVIILPIFVIDKTGFGQTWFCKYICPAGTLEAGLPLMLLSPDLRSVIGILFYHKLLLLILFFIWSIVNLRPFCRAICPLGLIFGFFNKISWLRLKFHKSICVDCHACELICPTEVMFASGKDDINSTKCIRCMKCIGLCPGGAVTIEFSGTIKESEVENEKGCSCHQK